MRKDKKEASHLRQKGLSYNEISQRLGVPKSTLSSWFNTIKKFNLIKIKNINKAKKKWARNITAFNKQRSREARKNWIIDQKQAAKEIKKINLEQLKLIGIALYWAEGYKKGNWNIVFCNSDSNMINIMIKFFVRVCGTPVNKIKAQIQVHPNISVISARKYWLKVTKLPLNQFLKPIRQVSKSSTLKHRGNLPFGTLRLKINDVKLVNRIKGWIIGLAANY